MKPGSKRKGRELGKMAQKKADQPDNCISDVRKYYQKSNNLILAAPVFIGGYTKS